MKYELESLKQDIKNVLSDGVQAKTYLSRDNVLEICEGVGFTLKETEKLVSILGNEVVEEFPWKNGMKPSTNDNVEGVLRRTWRPALSIVGSDGLPPTANAGNVLRPYTTLQLSMRIPPMVDAKKATEAIKKKLTESIPYEASVKLHFEEAADGWNAPETSPWLIEAIEKASENY